jgi:Uma2 family endonuclease
MNMLVTVPTLTPEDLLRMPDGNRYELVDGRLKEMNVSVQTGIIVARVIWQLNSHCVPNNLGWVLASENGYQCFPDRPNLVRKPDASFIQASRLTAELLAQGWARIPPDLAVEVVSPNDLAYEVEEKVELYFRVNVRMVWVVFPETRTVRVCRPTGSDTRLHEQDTLKGEDVVPGFACLVRDLFPPPLPAAPTA